MTKIIYDAKTGETTIEEVANVATPATEDSSDAKAEALEAIQNATTIASLKAAMLNYIEVSGVN